MRVGHVVLSMTAGRRSPGDNETWWWNDKVQEVIKAKKESMKSHKLAQNIKSDSKSFYAYVRSKQNVRDRDGPLEDNAGNILTQGFLMAEELNMHFSSVFTREDTSSIPVPEKSSRDQREKGWGS